MNKDNRSNLPERFTVTGLDTKGPRMRLVLAVLEQFGIACISQIANNWSLAKVDVSCKDRGYWAGSRNETTEITLEQFLWDYDLAPKGAEWVALGPEGDLVWYKNGGKHSLVRGDLLWKSGEAVLGVLSTRPTDHTYLIGDTVKKKSGSEWEGVIVGTYSTSLTPEGYAVESTSHAGSVQIYPVGALEPAPEAHQSEECSKPWTPEVGTECEVLYEYAWVQVFIVGKDREGHLVFQLPDAGYDFLYDACVNQTFRPIDPLREKFRTLVANIYFDGDVSNPAVDKMYDDLTREGGEFKLVWVGSSDEG